MECNKASSAAVSPPEPLMTFSFFLQLPYDLRLYIYRQVTPSERFVHLEAIFDDENSNDGEDELEESWQQPTDEDSRNTKALDQVLRDYLKGSKERGILFFSNHGQTQLETYGFTSVHPKPELPSDAQLSTDALRSFLAKRKVTMWSPNPVPALLHVCRESREYLRRLGYELAFPTYTSPAATWFNFKDDILFLKSLTTDEPLSELCELASFGISDGGCWSLGQSGQSLERIRKLAVPVPDYYLYTKEMPSRVHEVVQQCGHLQEICFVKNKWDDWHRWNTMESPRLKRDITGRLHMPSSPDQLPIRVKVTLEEMLGECLPLCPWQSNREVFLEGSLSSELAEDVKEQIRSHDPVLHHTVDQRFQRESWTTPEVTFALVISQEALELFLKNKHRFVQQDTNADLSMEPYARYFDRHVHEVSRIDDVCYPTGENSEVIFPFWGWKMDTLKYVYGPCELPYPLGLIYTTE